MKGGGVGWGGGGGGGGGTTKRRWRWLVIGVLGLVFLSMLVPLVFLLGFHSGGTLPFGPFIFAESNIVFFCSDLFIAPLD